MNKMAGIQTDLQKLHEPGVTALQKMMAIPELCKRMGQVLEPIERQIRDREVREAESHGLRKFYVVGKADDDIRDHEALEAKLPQTRSKIAAAFLDVLAADDKKTGK